MNYWIPLAKVIFFWIAFNFLIRMTPALLGIMSNQTEMKWMMIGVIATLVALGLTFIYLKLEGKTWSDINFKWTSRSLPRFLAGLITGMVLCGTMLATVILLSSLEIRRVQIEGLLQITLISVAIILILGWMEEIAYRSYPLLKLHEKYGLRVAIYVSSIGFAFYHGWSPSNLLGPGVWGIFYGLLAIWSKGIALPTGFHVGLNWMQALLNGKPKYGSGIWEVVEGNEQGLFKSETVGFVLQLTLFILGVVLVEWYIRRHHQADESTT